LSKPVRAPHKPSKYCNRKVEAFDDVGNAVKFDSKAEAKRADPGFEAADTLQA
jgi:hypothetical protein